MYPNEGFTPYTPPEPPKPVYSPADTAYAWISLLAAFLFCQAVPVTEHPLGGFLLILGLFVSGFVILRLKKVKITPVCIISAVSSIVIGSALLLTNAIAPILDRLVWKLLHMERRPRHAPKMD